jgi:hypothetical protein
MSHDWHTTDVNARGGPRPEPRPPWLDRNPVAGTALGLGGVIVLIFLVGIIFGTWVTS